MFVVDRSSSELVQYDPVSQSAPPKQIVVPLESLGKHTTLAVHNDLLDCRIDICSPGVRASVPTRRAPAPREAHPPLVLRSAPRSAWTPAQVPALFTENFDYADIRRDFLRGILDSDILSSKIYVHIAEEGYAARVDSIRTYGAVRCVPWAAPCVGRARGALTALALGPAAGRPHRRPAKTS